MSYTLLCFFHTCMSDLAAFDTPEQEQKKEVQQEIATTFKDFFWAWLSQLWKELKKTVWWSSSHKKDWNTTSEWTRIHKHPFQISTEEESREKEKGELRKPIGELLV